MNSGVRESVESLLAWGADPRFRSLCGQVLTLYHPRKALDLLDKDEHIARAKACVLLGRVRAAEDHLVAAERAGDARSAVIRSELLELLDRARGKPGRPTADGLLLQGDIRGAAQLLPRMLDLAIAGRIVSPWDGRRTEHLVALCAAGYGDFLQYARYLPAARQRCDRMTVAVPRALHSIARQAGPDEVVALDELHLPLQEATAYTAVWFTLALAVGQAYGAPLPVRSERSVRLSPRRRHVGLCWAASAAGAARSIPFESLEPLRALPDVEFHSLQFGGNEAGAWVTQHEFRSFDDTAALISGLDSVVSVDTAVAHLAANMSKPTELLLTGFCDPRWGRGDRTGWYPTVRIHRGPLDDAIESIRRVLAGAS